jgi:hypothetical protein
MTKKRVASAFDYTLDFKATDFRQHPELYRIGRGEQGVLLVEPYKSEILPHWRFKTVAEAKKSSAKIYKMFLAYLKAGDFPGADMARKFLQMGWTRARRYSNHKGGRKYDSKTGKEPPRTVDQEKAAAAAIFSIGPALPAANKSLNPTAATSGVIENQLGGGLTFSVRVQNAARLQPVSQR